MSWQGYVDDALLRSGQVSQAAIFSHDGSQWAVSPGFEVNPDEVQAIITGFTDPAGLYAPGIHVNGEKYFVMRADDRSIYGRKNSDGCCIVKTGQVILVCTYKEVIQSGQCTNVVETLANYLISVGY